MLLGMIPTLTIMAVCFVIALWAWWQDRKPYEPGNMPLISPIFLLYVCIIVIVIMAAHLVELYTGMPFKGRSSRGF
jgi:uncharacterized membrane protein